MNINDDALLRGLLAILVALKADRVVAFRLSTEVAALRSTLRELNGDHFLPLVEQHRKKLLETAASTGDDMEAEMLREVDALIPLFHEALPDASV